MAPYHMSLGEQPPPQPQPEPDMSQSQDTSNNDLLSDDEDLDSLPFLSVPVHLPDALPSDNSSLPQLLSQACGTEDYRDATSVQLRVISSQTSLQRLHIYLPHLVELDLTGSHLQSLRTLGFGLEHLQVLKVGRCALTTLDGLFAVSELRELYAPNNSITELGLLPTLPSIRVLDLRRNLVSNMVQVAFLAMCGELRELTLAECPVCELPGYKAAVLTNLPNLAELDGELLAEGGRDECGEARPKSPDHSDEDDGATALPVEQSNSQGGTAKEMNSRCQVVKIQRPSTVCGPRSVQRDVPVLPVRPATAAAPRRDAPLIPDEEEVADTVSKLTSGGVVCGNLAAALRGKHRQQKPAWLPAEEEPERNKLSCKNGYGVAALYEEVERIDSPHKRLEVGAGDANAKNTSSPLLEASRQWRESYRTYRQSHREQWEKEKEEDGV